jgi:alkanesulfonate monooxygenase SsuD/methylene tetrahydromethanopterin reductase-like flavin-dependent oxidoreductase (luciferase family)
VALAEGGPVEIGIYLPQVSMDYDDILRRARTAEDAGLHSVWFYDHLYSPGQPDRASLESWTLASFVLAQTRQIRVGHLVLCNNFRHPVVLAKMATTLDVLSQGRLELGLGSGSVEVEHRQAGLPWGTAAERSERLGEALAIVTAMLADGPTTFAGHHYQVESIPNLPPPVQRPRPPLHIGGMGRRRTLPLVARFADVWSIPTYGLDRWEEAALALAEECHRIGRDPATIRRSHEAVLVLAPDEASLAEARAQAERRYGTPGWGLDAGGYVGTPSMVAERIAAAAERGITSFVFLTHDRGDPRTLDLLGERVVPLL